MKLKSFCTTKEIVAKLKTLPTEWEKIFASSASDKGLITKIYRKLKKLNSHKSNDTMKNWANELNSFSKEEIQMSKKREEMFTIPGHKRNEIQNHTKIPSHSC
jgi:uridine kinase